MKALYIPLILIVLLSSAIAYTNSPITMPGFNVSSAYDINLKNKSIWNGTVNGTNFELCDTSTYASSWNGSNLICVTKGGVETDPIAEASKVNKSGDNYTGDIHIQNSAILFENITDGGILGAIDNYENAATGQITSRTIIGRGLNKSTNTVTLGKYGQSQTGYIMQLNSITGALGVVRYRYYPINSTTPQTFFSSDETNTSIALGNFTVSSLAGTGNAYDCLDSNGKHYRGSPTC